MIALVAKLNVAPGKEAEFEKVMLGLAEQVRANEDANHLYTLVKDDDGYAVLELYDDDAALQTHMQSSHFREAGSEVCRIDGWSTDDDTLRSRRLAQKYKPRGSFNRPRQTNPPTGRPSRHPIARRH